LLNGDIFANSLVHFSAGVGICGVGVYGSCVDHGLNLMIAVSLLVDRKVVGGAACEERQAEGEESTL